MGSVVAVIQARTASTRLPGKALQLIAGRPLVAWTIESVRAIPGVDTVVLATTDRADDDPLSELATGLGVSVHRGSVEDVLTRCWDAVAPLDPSVVLRQTADNPFPDPDVAAAQLALLEAGGFDYVGIAGWPHGIAAEVVRAAALRAATEEARDADEREHVTLFVRRRPERFRFSVLPPPAEAADRPGRFTVDTSEDLEAVRRLADALGHGPPVRLAELRAILEADPTIGTLNDQVEQRDPAAGPPRA